MEHTLHEILHTKIEVGAHRKYSLWDILNSWKWEFLPGWNNNFEEQVGRKLLKAIGHSGGDEST